MAEEARGNGQSNPPPAPEPQQLIFNAQYIKDLSFENPRAPQSLIQQTTPLANGAATTSLALNAFGVVPSSANTVFVYAQLYFAASQPSVSGVTSSNSTSFTSPRNTPP